MRAVAQITITNINDTTPSATAPANPYLGQSWTDTSKNPPVTKIWDGSKWMDKLGAVEETVTLHTKEIKEHSAKILANEDDISLKVAQKEYNAYKTLVDGELDSARKNMSDTSTTIAAMQGAIALKVEQVDIDSAINVVDNKFDSYSTTKQMTSAIELSKTGIISSVASTYATKTENSAALNAAGAAQSTANTAKTTAEQTATKFEWVVKDGTTSSDFTLTDRVASLLSSQFNIDALTTFKNSAQDGTATVINGGAIKANSVTADKIKADSLESISAKIGGFNINSTSLYNGMNKIDSTTAGVYIGTDGLALGGGVFKVTAGGTLNITGTVNATSIEIKNELVMYYKSLGATMKSIALRIEDRTVETQLADLCIGDSSGNIFLSAYQKVQVSGRLMAWDGIMASGSIDTSGSVSAQSIELSYKTPFIDFHYGNSAADYTARIIADTATGLSIVGGEGLRVGQIRMGNYIVRPVGNNGLIGVADANNTPQYAFAREAHNHTGLEGTVTITKGNLLLQNNQGLWIKRSGGANTEVVSVTSSDNTVLGSTNSGITVIRGASVRLKSTSGTVVTSDARCKQNIVDIQNKYLDTFMDMKIVEFEYKDNPEKKQIGLIAQEYEDVLMAHGIDSEHFAGIELPDYTDEIVNKYALNYSTIQNIHMAVTQRLVRKIIELERLLLKS